MEQLLVMYQVPQRLPFLCLSPVQVRLQSHVDVIPACITRYRPTKEAVEYLRRLMTEEVLLNCYLYVALMGSWFDNEVCGIRAGQLEQQPHLELRVLQPTMSSSRMVVGDIVSGYEAPSDFIEGARRAVCDALEAAQAVRIQRDLLVRNRNLREIQDCETKESEMEDRRKTEQAGPSRKENMEAADDEGEHSQDDTIVDSEEVTQNRILMLQNRSGAPASKRPRQEEDDDDEDDKSGTVTFNYKSGIQILILFCRISYYCTSD